MATWNNQIVGSAPQVTVRFNMTQGTQSDSGNWTDVNWSVQSVTSNGSRTGTWDWSRNVNGQGGSGSNSSTHSGTQTLSSGTYRITHDANGYRTISGSGYLDAFYGSGSAGGSLTLSRLSWPPSNNAPTSSLESVVSARITASASNNGRGTSIKDYDIRYRKQGDAGWTTRGFGASTWNITGLTPGATYEMSSRARNNNNDTADWTTGTYTFQTLPAPNTSAALLRIVGVM